MKSRAIVSVAALVLAIGALVVDVGPALGDQGHGAPHHFGNHALIVSATTVTPLGASNDGDGDADDVSCANAPYTTISAAVAAAQPGATIIVCPGTYVEDVTVTKSLTIEGLAGATVAPSATDTSPVTAITQANDGFTIVSPWVSISGFTVEGATGDGIFVLGDHALIQNNSVENNGFNLTPNPGNGIDLDGSSYSEVSNNYVTGSANGGIQLANDPDAIGLPAVCGLLQISCTGITGTATHDRVINNDVTENPYACGILLVDHAGTTDGTLDLADGVHDNLIQGNVVTNNAIQGYGAGILLATEAPGGAVYNNLITGNSVSGNGLAGLTLHAHLAGQDLNGNVIVGNNFGTNNLKGGSPYLEEPSDGQTTGVFVGSQDHLTIVVANNTIHDNYYGVFTAGPNGVTVIGVNSNQYYNDTTPYASINTYSG
jgi:parallel beta-helix repeat protein